MPAARSNQLIVFTLGSIACGFAQSLWMLVLGRLVL
jgi:predicted MFS family arabinose efflux permease